MSAYPNTPTSVLTPPAAPAQRAAAGQLAFRTRVALVIVTIGTAAVTIFGGHRVQRSLAAPAAITTSPKGAHVVVPGETIAVTRESWVSPLGLAPAVHSCATTRLPNGDLISVWFGGSREGAADVALYTARYQTAQAAWTAPVRVVDRQGAQEDLGRGIKKLGNAVVFADANGTLWLAYVTVTVGGWSGSTINLRSSRDDGHTWSGSTRLTVNPLFNFSSLVRNKPVFADDGRIGLPIYHEFVSTHAQMLWFTPTPDGEVADYVVRQLPASRGLIQPAVVSLGNNRMAAMLRDHTDQRILRVAYSEDNGWNWSKPVATTLPNPDAAIDALRLRDGRIVLAYNDAANGRENLRLATSADDGRTWQAGPRIEAEAGQEFSYPHLTEDGRGLIHLTYTWKRQRIKDVAFNVAWLAAPRPGPTP